MSATLFTVYDGDTKVTEIVGGIQHVKGWLNPSAPWVASVMGTIASDGRGTRFRLERREVKA